ncbi:InlB B-repeat-containing protein [Candidatus Magnetobacterium casense]|uniref:Bacterial repeat domain-containing protein n=1 Tax=Candidatus Magnetobacterium casense TaxID=1455061 RepID=A0ABS6S2H2_9BACT|nr:FG-GAP-like repeat-containing protein [Candidatus Magnetobacterium casensis]MBV6342832.1 hypothetical protein [Candidatus Magnetobacterium casensis]
MKVLINKSKWVIAMFTVIGAMCLAGIADNAHAAEIYTFVTKWGSFGAGDGQFFGPSGVAVDSAGNVYVADTNNDRIQKFDSNGTFITKWGSLGAGAGQFNTPIGVAVDSAGNVYVADFSNHRIQKFAPPASTPTPTPTSTPPPNDTVYYTLTVSKVGTGSGSVAGSPMQLTWSGNTGVVTRPEHSVQVITAAASGNSTFAGWSGDCSGTAATCVMPMTKNLSVTATFNLPLKTLTVTRAGTGNGTVTASPGTLTWSGNTGTAEYPDAATVVTLTAATSDGSTFTGWTGDCSGTNTTCTVTMSKAVNVTATFTLVPKPLKTLTVTRAGTGNGTVTVSPGTLTWSGNTGTTEYPDSTVVTLTATASFDSIFAGWGGDCSGTTPTCTVTMSKAVNVTAIFGLTRTLTINITGDGEGSVTASNGIIFWNFKTGTALYGDGTEVTLTGTPIPGSGSMFMGWTGCDSTNGPQCVVKITGSRAVTAMFHIGVKDDFDADGRSDIFLQDSSSGDTAIWFMNGINIVSKAYPANGVSGEWRFLARGEFDGNDRSDIVWQHTNGDVVVWSMDGARIAATDYVANGVPSEWQFKGIGDFNGDDKSDILWQHINGDVVIWLMNGAYIVARAYVERGIPSVWQIRGVGNFDGDGKADILWQDDSGDLSIWFMDGSGVKSKDYLEHAVAANWQIKAVAGFNGDGMADILWQDSSTGDVAVWLVNGASVITRSFISRALPGNWQLKDTGDYDGDGIYDMLWQDSSTGDVVVWFMDGTGIRTKDSIEKGVSSNWLIK